jgi:ABC-2 type transport system permease protein
VISSIEVLTEALKREIASRMAYRTDFFINAGMSLLTDLVMPAITLLIYQSGGSFPGWTLYEALLIQGIFSTARGIAFTVFFGIVWNVFSHVREGTFDLLLVKPRSALYLALINGIDSDNASRILSGIVMTAVALANLPPPGVMQWLQFTVLFLLSLSVLFSLTLLMSGTLFKWVGNSRVYEVFDSLVSFGLYPKTIFSRSFQTIISTIIPVAMIGFFPASALIGRPSGETLVAAVACVVLLSASLLFWHTMLRSYTSAGG